MKSIVLFFACVALAQAGLVDLGIGESTQSRSQDIAGNYAFAYKESHKTGGSSRAEKGDAHGNKVGSYSLHDIDGRVRQVDYVADKLGFRAAIKTNEPGTAPQSPAATILSAPAVQKAVIATAPAVSHAVIAAPAYGGVSAYGGVPAYGASIVSAAPAYGGYGGPAYGASIVHAAAPAYGASIVAAAPAYGGYGAAVVPAVSSYSSVVSHAAPAYGVPAYGAY